MAFWSRKKEYDGKKGYLAIPEEMFDAPFEDIIACMDPSYLVDAVCLEFDNIFCNRKFEDYRYLRLYPRWMNLLAGELDTVLYHYVEKLEDCKKLIQYFPEFASHIYEFLIDEYICNQSIPGDCSVGDEIDIVNDVIIPISDLERYQCYHFSSIRKRELEILDICDSYSEMWDIIWAFETYLDIPREHFQEYLVSCFQGFIEGYDEHYYAEKNTPAIYGSEDFEALKHFIRDAEAYWYLMDRAPNLIMENGLDFYTMLVKVLGPAKEVLDLHDYCSEFVSKDFKEVLSDML